MAVKRSPFSVVPVICLMAFTAMQSGCSNVEGTTIPKGDTKSRLERKHSQAIESVIAQDAAIADTLKQKRSNVDSRDFQRLVDAMRRIDLRDCPADFQSAYLAHRYAWAQVAPYAAKYEGVVGVLHAFTEGLTGSNALEDDEKRIRSSIEQTWFEVEKIALRFGVHPGR